MNKTIHNYIVTDVETGGLDATKNAITEIAAIAVRGDEGMEEIARYTSYIKPYGNLGYEPKALEFTGITMDMINDGEDYRKVVKGLEDVFQEANKGCGRNKKPILVGHNITFDINFYLKLFELAKVDLSKYLHGKKDCYGNWSPIYIDTLATSNMKFGGTEIPNLKLATCVDFTGVQLIDCHRAIDDTIMTKEMFIAHCASIRGSSKGGQAVKKFRHTFEF